MGKKEFAAAALDPEHETFVVHVVGSAVILCLHIVEIPLVEAMNLSSVLCLISMHLSFVPCRISALSLVSSIPRLIFV